MFSDIRGFSRISEQLEPEVLSEYLNQYFTPMTRLIMEADGLLDKYIGDAVMAVYGAPLEQPDHAARACRTALAMLGALGPLNDRWRRTGLDGPIAIGQGVCDDPRWQPFCAGTDDRCDACLLAPLRCRGQFLGLMTLEYRKPHAHGRRDVQLAVTIAGLVGARLDVERLASSHAELAERLETRIAVDRAKGILQRNLGLTEDEAYRAIQRESRQRRSSKREVAEAIILGDAVGRATTRDLSASS